ncbi:MULTISPECIES: Asp23/Gls24 family envelope stress response protein [unclassified Streptomyces]|uniref:Asp23/Gls24 family envelope stress response protein n=1 Tax=unclassified Streptomyces TaxID=2593676 RepID=UPI0033E12DC8
MTGRPPSAALTEAVREAVLGTPGVAFLRPGVAELLRASNPLTRTAGAAAALGTSSRSSGVRVTGGGGEPWNADIRVVLRRGHRALDVTRAVRAAVTEALLGPTGDGEPPRVSVTVTGRV